MPCARNLSNRELLEVVLLQCGQNAPFETLVVPDEHAYVLCAESVRKLGVI
jgi:hypothetical protein